MRSILDLMSSMLEFSYVVSLVSGTTRSKKSLELPMKADRHPKARAFAHRSALDMAQATGLIIASRPRHASRYPGMVLLARRCAR